MKSTSFLLSILASHEVCQFELLAQFLYNAIQEDDIDYPMHMTMIYNVTIGSNGDVYAAILLFVSTCSKSIYDATLHSLKQFVSNAIFSID